MSSASTSPPSCPHRIATAPRSGQPRIGGQQLSFFLTQLGLSILELPERCAGASPGSTPHDMGMVPIPALARNPQLLNPDLAQLTDHPPQMSQHLPLRSTGS